MDDSEQRNKSWKRTFPMEQEIIKETKFIDQLDMNLAGEIIQSIKFHFRSSA